MHIKLKSYITICKFQLIQLVKFFDIWIRDHSLAYTKFIRGLNAPIYEIHKFEIINIKIEGTFLEKPESSQEGWEIGDKIAFCPFRAN